MPSRPWYRKFPADYAAKTTHLSQGEHGAYMLLLDWQYANSCPLPASLRAQFRIACAESRSEKANCVAVVEEYFEEIDGGLWNPRAYQELSANAAARKRMAEAGRKGAKSRWGTPKGTPEKPHRKDDGVSMVRARDQIQKDKDLNTTPLRSTPQTETQMERPERSAVAIANRLAAQFGAAPQSEGDKSESVKGVCVEKLSKDGKP